MSKTPGSEKRKRTINKSFRFSPEEWAEFTAKADAVGLPYAEYMRMQCLDRVPRRRLASPLDRKLAARLLGQLGKVGSNINQIAKAANAGRLLEASLEAALVDLAEMRAAWMQTFGYDP